MAQSTSLGPALPEGSTTTLDDVTVTPQPTTETKITAPQANFRGSAPYAKRIIKLTFQLSGTGTAGGAAPAKSFAGGGNKVEITGLRTTVQLSQAALLSPTLCTIRVQGLILNQINSLTKAGLFYSVSSGNGVAVEAGDSLMGLSTVFNGTIQEAYPDFSGQPDVAFIIIANPQAVIQLKPVEPVSFPKTVPITTALEKIIKPAGLTLDANGIKGNFYSPYFPGTVWQQMGRALKAAGAFGFVDDVAKKLIAWPKDGSAKSSGAPTLNIRNTIGYPEFQRNRIRLRILFDMSFKATKPGSEINVETELAAANGKWTVDWIDYLISAETPDGPWEMVITAHPRGK
jgi:hypothetical protein